MSEPAQKCESHLQAKLSMLLKWPIIAFWLKGKSRFSRFPPRKVFNINYSPCLNRNDDSLFLY